MKYLAAYLLIAQGGVEAPSATEIKAVLESVGIEAEDAKIDALFAALEGKSINELIAEGQTKLASVPAGGAAAAAGSSGAAASSEEAAAEEKEEEAKEESDDDMGFGLFD
ncbi:60S acidic ribosomal protein P2-B [Kluyveromyces marxianus]|nr:60S acidic ribosomal protein P2 [Kluyveromyces marxianus]KAG0685828.1 60S acidic ribosomal protein P2 [Kluyveromyces marxianus]